MSPLPTPSGLISGACAAPETAIDLVGTAKRLAIPKVADPAALKPRIESAASTPGNNLVVDADAEIVEKTSTLKGRRVGKRKVETPRCYVAVHENCNPFALTP